MSAAASNDNGNGRVTLALIKHDIDGMKSSIDALTRQLSESCKRYDEQIGGLREGQVKRQEQIDNIRGDVSALEAKSNTWSVINSIIAFIAGILGVFGISR